MSRKKILIYSIILITIFLFGLFLYNWIIPKHVDNTVYIRVNKGESLDTVLSKLDKEGIEFSLFFTKLFYKVFPKQINAGDYYFKENFNLIKLSNILKKGFFNGIKITIPEGFRYKEIKERLYRKGLINKEKFEKLFKDKKFINSLGIKSETLEGYLFPETYYFVKENSEKEIIKRMYNLLLEKLKANNLLSEIENSKYNLQEILTIASLVEWEAKIDDERKKIAQVFIKRLEIYKPLESCASIEYALNKHKKKLFKRDLEVESPYNTYKNFGLPPTPINNPGIKSINAVINPADTDYLYFVSKNDGTHVFNESYDKHLEAKRKYQSW
ncbi:MAG: endolytic transglycosylase MltG [Candidatus Mcinerneyibacterium aminivorans]|jgi:UPF0755 protein|uniref:Endolytic murein transglycosylase n=1 Tax=Candidatus Mcinerneyibacterium aminivorans TaxID=2703815 RepID=A0A5D0MCA8_9BACT|nr:MAG: endolytic transglycosylase MltG [Candidatus Mcinerneyibacterium aminivorans]